MSKKKLIRVRDHSIYYDPRNLKRRIVVPCFAANKEVELQRDAIDVLRSKRGTTIGCTNSNCASRLGKLAFGHEAYLVEFTKTSCYVVDKLDRNFQPVRCIWYKHSDGATIDLNDHVSDRTELLRRVDANGVVRLRPPKLRQGTVVKSGKGPRAEIGVETERRKAISYGAARRAKKAGLVFTQNG